MTLDLDNFLDRLAKWFVARAALLSITLKYDQVNSDARQLWIHSANEGNDANCASPFSVISMYTGGNADLSGAVTVPVQVMTIGTDAQEATQRASLLFGLFWDKDTRQVIRNVDFTECRFMGPVNLRPPGVIGRDQSNRYQVVFNFDAMIAAKA